MDISSSTGEHSDVAHEDNCKEIEKADDYIIGGVNESICNNKPATVAISGGDKDDEDDGSSNETNETNATNNPTETKCAEDNGEAALEINSDNRENEDKEDNEEDVYASILSDIHQIKTEDVDELLLSTATAAASTDSAAEIHLLVNPNPNRTPDRNETKSSSENSVDERLKLEFDEGIDGVSKFQNPDCFEEEVDDKLFLERREEEMKGGIMKEALQEGDGVNVNVHPHPPEEPCNMKDGDALVSDATDAVERMADAENIVQSTVESTVAESMLKKKCVGSNEREIKDKDRVENPSPAPANYYDNENDKHTCNANANGNGTEQNLQLQTQGENQMKSNADNYDDNGAFTLEKENDDDKGDEIQISKDFELLRLNNKSKNPVPADRNEKVLTGIYAVTDDVYGNDNLAHVEDDAKSCLSQSTISTSPSLYHSQLDMNKAQPLLQTQQQQQEQQEQLHPPLSQHTQHSQHSQHSQQPQDNAQLVTDDEKNKDNLHQPKQTLVLPPNTDQDNFNVSILNTTNDNDISYDETVNSTNFRSLHKHYENLLSKQQQEHTKQIDDILLQLSSIESTYHDEINKLKSELSKKEVMCDALTASLSEFKRRNTTLEKDIESSASTCSELEYKFDAASTQLQEANREIIALRQHYETLRISSEKEKQEAVSFAQQEIQTQAETQFAIAQKKYIQLKNNHQQNLQEKQILEEQLSTLQQQIQNKERIHEGHLSQLKEELNVLRMELSSSKLENQKVKSILNERMNQLESREKELDQQLEIKSKEHRTLLREKNTLKKENMELQSVCEELMSMVEQGVDHGGGGTNGMNIPTNAYNNDTTSPSVASKSSRSSR